MVRQPLSIFQFGDHRIFVSRQLLHSRMSQGRSGMPTLCLNSDHTPFYVERSCFNACRRSCPSKADSTSSPKEANPSKEDLLQSGGTRWSIAADHSLRDPDSYF